MIEFDGYISGDAEKLFWKKSRNLVQNILLLSLLLISPLVILIFRYMNFQYGWVMIPALLIVIPLALRIPKSEKEKLKLKPKKIYTEEEYIISVSGMGGDCKLISDVKQVNDYGEFYEIVFPFGKVSNDFICQKNLLTKGTVEEFEALFNGKIVKKYK